MELKERFFNAVDYYSKFTDLSEGYKEQIKDFNEVCAEIENDSETPASFKEDIIKSVKDLEFLIDYVVKDECKDVLGAMYWKELNSRFSTEEIEMYCDCMEKLQKHNMNERLDSFEVSMVTFITDYLSSVLEEPEVH